ncbi:hypothetical protein FBU30_002476 [Linnemannia zychae]|nr:hypothetical protein FBU30_002476 [Linnemannia zychae]
MGANWKREKVESHKFDFINVDDFVDNSCWRQFRYMLVFLIIIRGILVYCSDVFTAVNLLTGKKQDDIDFINNKLPYEVYKYLFTGCIFLGLVLLALDMRRAKGIIRSRDISYAFTSQIASRYYTVRSYPHYCFFAEIENSKKFVDNVAFFVFFTFRNWKRLLLANAPRQVINATILYNEFHSHSDFNFFNWTNRDLFTKITYVAMIFTLTVFVSNMVSFIAATFMYIPLVFHIQGNLKEYCCYKIDKRIEELIKKSTKDRAKGGKDIAMDYMGMPTLPDVDVLESAPKPTVPPLRNAYPKGPAPSPYVRQQQQHQQDYNYGYNTQGGYNNSSNQSGYVQNYSNEDYYQTKPAYSNSRNNYQRQPRSGGKGVEAAFDPYADSAFTTNDIYDQYSSSQDQLHSQRSHDNYYKNIPSKNSRGGGNSGGGGGKYDDYAHLRSASPLPSQHGSDLDSNHYSNSSSAYGHGGNGGNGGYGNTGNNGAYYRNDSYSTNYSGNGGGGTPQRPRRNDQDRYRGY